MSNEINESQFYMWRTVFALAHADNVITEEEASYMREALEDIRFTSEQRRILEKDMEEAQDAADMFQRISNPKDRTSFFDFAREMVWVDGDFGPEEQEVMIKLKRIHMQQIDVDSLVGNSSMEFEPDEGAYVPAHIQNQKKKKKDMVFSFRRDFLKKISD